MNFRHSFFSYFLLKETVIILVTSIITKENPTKTVLEKNIVRKC